MSVSLSPVNDTMASALRERRPEICLYWLGQAGFALCYNGTLVLIDPYLSDALAKKYAGTQFPHQRMMPAPISAAEIPRVDWVLISHRHGDHFDVETLLQLSKFWPKCRFILPAAELENALAMGMPRAGLVPINAGESLNLANMKVSAIPAAHENLERNNHGLFHFLGYVIECGGSTIYHSGDCIPYSGLNKTLEPFSIDLALLPVNGRDDYRASNNIPGNFTLSEAAQLCNHQKIPVLIAHHFDMFAFNTISRAEIEASEAAALPCHVLAAATATRYSVSADHLENNQ